jgi:Flp pilus assembly secretin CpaC
MSAPKDTRASTSLACITGGLRAAAASVALSCLMAATSGTPAHAQSVGESSSNTLVDVAVDEARVMRINRAPNSVILGNPLIADAVIEENGVIVLLGRNYGTTNLIALDGQGEAIATYDIVVRTSGRNAVSLFRGTGRTALNCSPRCERELDVGDETVNYETIKNQIEAKTGQSRAQADVSE